MNEQEVALKEAQADLKAAEARLKSHEAALKENEARLKALEVEKAQIALVGERAQTDEAVAEAQRKIEQLTEEKPTKAELQAKRETALAVAEAAAAKAKREAFDSLHPLGTSTPLEGTTTLDAKAGFLAVLAANQAMAACATSTGGEITTALDGKEEKRRILVVDSLAFARGDAALLQIDARFKLLKDGLADHEKAITHLTGAAKRFTALPAQGTLPLLAAKSAVSLLADVGGYFQTNYTVKGVDVPVNDEAFRLAVAGEVTKTKIKALEVQVLDFNILKSAAILDDFATLVTDRTKVEVEAEGLRKTELVKRQDHVKSAEKTLASKTQAKADHDKKIAAKKKAIQEAPTGDPGDIEKLKAELQELENALPALEAQIATATAALEVARKQLAEAELVLSEWEKFGKAFDATMASISTGTGSEPPALVLAALRQYVHDGKVTHLLFAKLTTTGGDAITQRSYMPWQSGVVSYVGGCTATYVLSKVDGAVEAAGTLTRAHKLKYSLREGRATAAEPVLLTAVTETKRNWRDICGDQAELIPFWVVVAAIFALLWRATGA